MKCFALLLFTLAFATGQSSTSTQQGAMGPYQPGMAQLTQQIDGTISSYITGDDIESVLTPGEFNSWSFKLVPGDVIVADAQSPEFDPALEVADAKGNVLAKNDDRYPGDQRPLLLWRCEAAGTYDLRVRSFHNKAGGRVGVRFTTYKSFDLTTDQATDFAISGNKPILLRVPMKAGEVKDLVADTGGAANYAGIRFDAVIYQSGMPEIAPTISELLSPAIRALVAPVAGDYYLRYSPLVGRDENRKIHVRAREISPTPLAAAPGLAFVGEAPTNTPQLWTLQVKAGQLFRATEPGLRLDCRLVVAQAPDFSKYGTDKDDTNPFYPHPGRPAPTDDPPIVELPARARDARDQVFFVKRDATLWISSNGAGPAGGRYKLQIAPAAAPFVEGRQQAGKLRVGDTDYWTFDAAAGDVMRFKSGSGAFDRVVVVRDPNLGELEHRVAAPDQAGDEWRMVAQAPGRYWVAVSSLGDGGGGAYALDRDVVPAGRIESEHPAHGEISSGQVQVWKLTVLPGQPKLLRWASSNWGYGIEVYNDRGEPIGFDLNRVAPNVQFSILSAAQPQTYIIVLTGGADKATYDIGLQPVPGFEPPAAPAPKRK